MRDFEGNIVGCHLLAQFTDSGCYAGWSDKPFNSTRDVIGRPHLHVQARI
jgi:hypothetical protein